MFGRYFGATYFGPSYFGPGSVAASLPPTIPGAEFVLSGARLQWLAEPSRPQFVCGRGMLAFTLDPDRPRWLGGRGRLDWKTTEE